MVLEQAPDPPSRHRPGLPAAFEGIVLSCLEKDPERRMPSALALRDALQPFLPAPHLLRSISDDVTKVAPPKRRPPPAPPPEPAPPREPVGVEMVEPALPPGVQTTAQPLVGAQHAPPARAGEGPSTRVVALVAASSLLIVAATFTALIRRAMPAAAGAPAPAAAPERSVAPSEVSAAAPAAPAPTESSEILEPSAKPLEPPAPSSERVAAAPHGGGAPEPGYRAPVKAAAGGRTDRSEGGVGGRIDPVAALGALSGAAVAAKRCKRPGGPKGSARVEVTFGPSGAVTSVRVGGPFDGTPVGKCIASVFRGARVPPFVGSSFSASKTVSIR
jgi:hypothetical protein